MSEPQRELVLAQLVTVLRGMTGLRGWGTAYPNDPDVSRVYRGPGKINQYPALDVLEGSGSMLAVRTTVGSQVGMRHDFRLTVFGYVSATGDVTRSTWLQRLWDDVITTVLKNQTLGGLSEAVRPEGEYETDEGELEPIGVFAQGLVVVLYEPKEVV